MGFRGRFVLVALCHGPLPEVLPYTGLLAQERCEIDLGCVIAGGLDRLHDLLEERKVVVFVSQSTGTANLTVEARVVFHLCEVLRHELLHFALDVLLALLLDNLLVIFELSGEQVSLGILEIKSFKLDLLVEGD